MKDTMNERRPHGFCETPESGCSMNYCDENGCMNRKRELVEPIDQLNNAMNEIREMDFIKSRPAFNISALARMIGLNRQNMHEWIKGKRVIPKSKLEELRVILMEYGFEGTEDYAREYHKQKVSEWTDDRLLSISIDKFMRAKDVHEARKNSFTNGAKFLRDELLKDK